MFFISSKILWPLITPLNLAALLFIGAGVMLLFKFRRTAAYLAGTGALIIILLGLTPIGPNALAMLEQQYKRPEELPLQVHGILVLGGSVDTALSSVYDMPILNDGAERLMSAVELSRRYPSAVLTFTGGDGRLLQNRKNEADITQDFLQLIGFDESNVFYEDNSRNTHENIVFSKQMLSPQPGETWLIVTSAYHMPRVMALLHSAQWPGTIIPWPVDYRTRSNYRWFADTFDVAGTIFKAQLALHEYIGYAVYRITGKISSID